MMAPKSSGSSPAESAVDPTRSQNSTVSCRRSIGRASRAVGTTAAGESTRNLVPQSPQNLFRAGLATPQAGQRRTATAPHRPQNFLFSGTSAAQFVQCIRTSTDINSAATMRQKSTDRCDRGHNPGCSVSRFRYVATETTRSARPAVSVTPLKMVISAPGNVEEVFLARAMAFHTEPTRCCFADIDLSFSARSVPLLSRPAIRRSISGRRPSALPSSASA